MVEQTPPSGLKSAVKRARSQAATTGELQPTGKGFSHISVPDELADFVQRILTDGTYARAIERIGDEDPDLADV